jgi:hypothetical protein
VGRGGEGAAVTQSEGKGLLEYQAMPFLRDVAHGGWLCTYILYNSGWKFHQLEQLGSSCRGNRYGTENKGSMARPSHTKSHAVTSPHTHAGGIRNKLCKDDFTLVS